MPLDCDAAGRLRGARTARARALERRHRRRGGRGRQRAAPERVANRPFGDGHLLRGVADRHPAAEQLRDALLLLGREAMGPARSPLAVHHAQHAVPRQVAMLPGERTAMAAERGAALVLLRQSQLDQLGRRDPLPPGIRFSVHEDRHARGEVRDLAALAHDGNHVIDLVSAAGGRGQLKLGRHRGTSSMMHYLLRIPARKPRKLRAVICLCQEP